VKIMSCVSVMSNMGVNVMDLNYEHKLCFTIKKRGEEELARFVKLANDVIAAGEDEDNPDPEEFAQRLIAEAEKQFCRFIEPFANYVKLGS